MRLILLLLLLPAACADMDPVYRPGDWLPGGSNSRNLAAMLAEPSDMWQGRGTTAGADMPLAANAVTRLWEGKAKRLPSASSQRDIITGGSSGGEGGGSTGSTGGS